MNLLFLTILFPFLGFVILFLTQEKCSKNISGLISIVSISISTLVSYWSIFDYYRNCQNFFDFIFNQKLWTWFIVNDFSITMSIRLDKLSAAMLFIISTIGFIVYIYSYWYMKEHQQYSYFFMYINLFMASMIFLVLSDNLLSMYFFWEIVGFCSYLLIGFYYSNSKSGYEAFKSFIMTRIGDIFLLCALFLIYQKFSSLDFHVLLKLDSQVLQNQYSVYVQCISLMLLIGALGKSAQIPLQTWLTDAMVGPTPVSALIHSATMVTSGVYLIARMNNFFLAAPNILYLVGIIGSLTLIISSISALVQTNIKKILAYSTMSQIGYMFLSLGGENLSAAIYHLIVHAFFKALLFLSAGSLIYVCKNEQNIFKMGGLYKSIPFIYFCFIIGGASLSAFPIVTSGFYSKEMILMKMFIDCNYFFLFSGLLGSILTPIYVFRMIYIVFHGNKKISVCVNNSMNQYISLGFLSIFSTFIIQWIKFPLLNMLYLESNNLLNNYSDRFFFEIVCSMFVIFGIFVALVFWKFSFLNRIKKFFMFLKKSTTKKIMLFIFSGWGFDSFYRKIFIKPYVIIIRNLFFLDPINFFTDFVISIFSWLRDILVSSNNGKLVWYILSMNIGGIILISSVLILNSKNF